MILFVLGLVASVPLAILANIVTPYAQTAITNRSERRIEHRLAEIDKELKEIQSYRRSVYNEFIAYCSRKIIYFIVQFTLVGVVDILAVVAMANTNVTFKLSTPLAIVAVVATFLAIMDAQRTISYIYKISNFDRYQEKVTQELAKLASGPEHPIDA